MHLVGIIVEKHLPQLALTLEHDFLLLKGQKLTIHTATWSIEMTHWLKLYTQRERLKRVTVNFVTRTHSYYVRMVATVSRLSTNTPSKLYYMILDKNNCLLDISVLVMPVSLATIQLPTFWYFLSPD